MDISNNNKAPEPENKKQLKVHTFPRVIYDQENTPLDPIKNDLKPEKKNDITLNFTLILYEDEIGFNIKEKKENPNLPNAVYEKSLNLETLKSFSKLFKLLNIKKNMK